MRIYSKSPISLLSLLTDRPARGRSRKGHEGVRAAGGQASNVRWRPGPVHSLGTSSKSCSHQGKAGQTRAQQEYCAGQRHRRKLHYNVVYAVSPVRIGGDTDGPRVQLRGKNQSYGISARDKGV